MSLLQLKNRLEHLPKKTIFLGKLSGICIIIHGVFLIFFFLINQVKKVVYLDTVHTNAPVVFVPLLKTAGLLTGQSAPTVLPTKKNTIKKNVVKKTSILEPKPVKPAVKKAVPNKEPVTKKTVMVPEKKKEVKAPEPKKKEPPIKKEIKKAAQPVAEVKKIDPVSVAIESKLPEQKTALQLVGRDDLELMALSNQVKESLLQQWKRPTNIPFDSCCQVRVIIDKKGGKEMIVEKSSHALMLDIAVRNFLTQYEFPEQAWDKEFVINF